VEQGIFNRVSGSIIARGAFGEISIGIWEPQLPENPYLVAEKVFMRPFQKAGVLRGDVEHELKAMLSIHRHDNVVRWFGTEQSPSSVSLILAYHPIDLYQSLEWRRKTSQPPLQTSTIRHIAIQMLSAILHVHRQGWIHGDVTLTNWLVSSSGDMVLTDFGLSRPSGTSLKREVGDGKTSLGYRAPEILIEATETMDEPADMYGFGVCLIEVVEQRKLWNGTSEIGHLNELSRLGPVPDQLKTADNEAIAFMFATAERKAWAESLPRCAKIEGMLEYIDSVLCWDPSRRVDVTTSWVQSFKGTDTDENVAKALIPPTLELPQLLRSLSLASMESRVLEIVKARQQLLL